MVQPYTLLPQRIPQGVRNAGCGRGDLLPGDVLLGDPQPTGEQDIGSELDLQGMAVIHNVNSAE